MVEEVKEERIVVEEGKEERIKGIEEGKNSHFDLASWHSGCHMCLMVASHAWLVASCACDANYPTSYSSALITLSDRQIAHSR